MANTVRQKILSTLSSDLAKITIANGYNNTIQNVYKKYMDIDNVCYPSLWFGFSQETRSQLNEDNSQLTCTLQVPVVGYIEVQSDTSNAGTLTDASENLIQDLQNCINQFKTQSCTLNSIKGILKWNITKIDPYLDDVMNKGIIVVLVEIVYIDDKTTANQ